MNGTVFFLKDAEILSGFRKDNTFEAHEEFAFSNGVRWIWKARTEKDSVLLVTAIRNESGDDIRIGCWNVLRGSADENAEMTLPDREKCRFFSWRPWFGDIVDLTKHGEQCYQSIVMTNLSEMPSAHTFQAAFVTVDRMNCTSFLSYDDTKGGFRESACLCDASEYRLRPGQYMEAEQLRLAYYPDQYTALESWADELNQRYHPSFEGTCSVQLGGGGWWNSPQMDVQDKRDGVCDFCDEHLSGFGFHLIHGGTHAIMKYSIPGHWMLFDRRKDGSSYEDDLRKYHGKGWDFKFWFSPFWFFGEAEETLEENKENLLKDEKGNVIVQPFHGFWEFARGPHAKKVLTQYFLDGTHPKTKEYLRKVMKFNRDLGCRAYMMDFLSIIPGSKYFDDTKLPIEASREIFRVIRESAGEDTHIQTAVSSSPGFIGCINSARVTRDFGETRPQAPFPNWRNAHYCMHDNHFSNIHAFMQNAAQAYFTNRKVYVNDLNAMTIDTPVPLNFAQIVVSMFGLSGDSPVAIGDDLKNMAPDRMRMFKMILPRTGGIPKPVDMFDRTLEQGGIRMLKKEIHTSWDDWMMVMVFNTDPDGAGIEEKVDFARLGLDRKKEYVVYEFWNNEYCGVYKDFYMAHVPHGACKLYRISERRPYPWVISTDMHVEQGRAEIESLAWDPETLTLTGVAKRPAGECGRIVFLLPLQIKIKDCYRINTMKEVIDMQTVCTYPIRFEKDREEFRIEFEKLDDDGICHVWWLPYHTISQREEWLKQNNTQVSNRILTFPLPGSGKTDHA